MLLRLVGLVIILDYISRLYDEYLVILTNIKNRSVNGDTYYR